MLLIGPSALFYDQYEQLEKMKEMSFTVFIIVFDLCRLNEKIGQEKVTNINMLQVFNIEYYDVMLV